MSNKYLQYIFGILFLMFGLNINIIAQNTFGSEEELKKEANKLFLTNDFSAAYPLYSQLLSLYPKDPNYNYKFGVCMLFATEDKEKPVSYLEFASKKNNVDKEVFFYLGKAYHLNYRFDDAIAAYNEFKKNASKTLLDNFQVERQIEMCNNGKSLLKNITDLIVLDKKELSEAEFFRSYDLSDIGGKLLVKPDDFKTSVDKKKNEKSIIFLAQNNQQVFYSSYGEDVKKGKDIFVVHKLPGGEFGKPRNFGTIINTNYDEDFPFLHPNGKVLYFSSKGHNSMGGYDIFKSLLDENTNTWSQPINLDFAINTPDDDILFVTDSAEQTAYFSSSRSSVDKMTSVYKIKTDRKPVDVSIVKGSFVKSEGSQSLNAKITVKNIETNELVGIYNTDEKTGNYYIYLPKNGKFMFTVESQGIITGSEIVTLPTQNEFKPIRQEITFKKQNGIDQLVVSNFFDEAIDDSNYLLALNFIKEKSKLEVNYNEAIQDTPVEPSETSLPETTSDANKPEKNTVKSNLSNKDIADIAYNDAKEAEKEAKELKTEADLALSIANERNELAQAKLKEAEQILRNAEKIEDQNQKQEEIAKGNALKKEADKLAKETVAAFNLAKNLESDADLKQKETDLSVKYAGELENAIQSNNSKEALAKLEAQRNHLESLGQQATGTDNVYNSLKSDAEKKRTEGEKTLQESESLKQEIVDLDKEVKSLRAEALKTNNEQLRDGMNAQAQELEDDVKTKQAKIETNEIKSKQLQSEAVNLNNEAEMVNDFISRIKTSSETPVEVSSIDKQKLEQQVSDYKTQQNNTIENNTLSKNDAFANNMLSEPYEKKINETENTLTGFDKEVAKNKIYKEWSEAIEKDITSKKQDLATSNDAVAKNNISQEITKMEKLLAEKQQLATESAEKSEQLKTQDLAQANTVKNDTDTKEQPIRTPDKSTESVYYSEKWSKELSDTVKISDPYEKELAKAESYKKWANAIDEDIAVKKEYAASLKDKEQHSVINTKIVDLEQLSIKKKALAQESLVKAEQVKSESFATNVNNVTPKTDNNETGVSKNTTTPTTVDQVKGSSERDSQVSTSENASPTDNLQKSLAESTESFSYSSPEATTQVSRAEAMNKEVENYTNQARTIRQEAAVMKDQEEKKKLLEKADIVEKQAQQEQVKIAEVYAAANKAEYTNRDSKLQQYSKASSENESDGVTIAGLLQEEANYYFFEAQKSRENASTQTDFSIKKEAMDKAYKSELIALEKQKKATDIYLKENPNLATIVNKKEPLALNNKKETQTKVNTEQISIDNVNTSLSSDNPSKESVGINNVPAPTQQNIETNTVSTPTSTADKKESLLVENSKESENYKALKNEAGVELQTAKSERKEADDYKEKAMKQDQIAQEMLLSIDTITNEKQKTETLYKSQQYSEQAKTYMAKADSVNELAKNSEATAHAKQTEADLFLQSLDKNNYENNASASTKKTDSRNETEANKTAIKADRSTPAALLPPLTNDVFEQVTTPVYSKESPIPINPGLPEGLVFKVQIGAFKNPIPQDLFKGMNPLMGETTDKGYIRYTAGLFSKFEAANQVKEKIRGMGYKDAFVVAFLNGKRIPINNALVMAQSKGITIAENTQVNAVTGKQNPKVSSEKTLPPSSENTNLNSDTLSSASNQVTNAGTAIVEAGDLKVIKGLLYTVQVGVYSQPVTSAQLFDIQPLYNETTENGSIRYTSGVYNTIEKAVAAKNEIIAIGIQDAFVTAYNNGKRISATEAKQLEAVNGNTILADAPNMNVLPKRENGSSAAISNAGVSKDNTIKVDKPIQEQNKKPSDIGLVYKVQIGAFKEEVPIEIANNYLKIASKGIANYKEENDLTIYTVGSFNNYEDANQLKNEVVTVGITGAFVVVYKEGKKISIEEAKQLQGN